VTTSIPRHLKFGLIVLGIFGAITLGLFVDVIGRIQSMVQERETEENPFTPSLPPLYTQTDPPMTVKLFFPGAEGDILLWSEDRTIYRSAELTKRARQIIQKLLEGPMTPDLFPSIPRETKLQEVFIDDSGRAYLDFTNSISANHPGGIVQEQATIYSIVNSLTYNLPEIQQVKILVGGVEKETLAGHCLLLPLTMDLSITNLSPPEEEQEIHEN